MPGHEHSPSAGALEAVRCLAGSSAAIESVTRLEGGQHAGTWKVETADPELTVVVRQFPVADAGAAREQWVLRTLDGLGGLAPIVLGADLDRRWSDYPTTLISWLDGSADIAPSDPEDWAIQLGRALAAVHATPADRLADFSSIFDRTSGSRESLGGPLQGGIRTRWGEITGSPEVLTHSDYWSGNVVWRDGALTGIVDWSGAARGPRGYDLGWCRLDLVLLLDERIADVFLGAYEGMLGATIDDIWLWDAWAVARSHEIVETWGPNYAPLGRADLDSEELRDRHSQSTARLLARA